MSLQKNDCLGIVGQAVLAVYFLFSCLARLTFVGLFFVGVSLWDVGSVPWIIFVFIPIVLVAVHLGLGDFMLAGIEGRRKIAKTSSRALDCLSTLSSPPMFVDWEDFHRQESKLTLFQ